MIRRGVYLATMVFVLFSSRGFAHELRPAYLQLTEESRGKFSVLWKTPMVGDARLALTPELSGGEQSETNFEGRRIDGAAVQYWMLRTDEIRGQKLTILGLETTMTEVLVRIDFLDGRSWTQRLTPSDPSVVIPESQSPLEVGAVYGRLGVQHIMSGIDHLLFVLGLLLLVHGTNILIKTITAFTVAHSLTLAVATLGYVHVPLPPVDACIALSIFSLAPEIARTWRGETSFMIRKPWVAAFCFGLLHGLGFSSAMANTGLPLKDLPLALLSFNVGVEIGQLFFVGAVMALLKITERLKIAWPIWIKRAPGYALGTFGSYWMIQRTAAMLGWG